MPAATRSGQTAAKERAGGWLERHQAEDGSLAALHGICDRIAGLESVNDVAKAAAQLASLPLPVEIYSIPKPSNRDIDPTDDAQIKSKQLAVGVPEVYY